MNQKNLNDLFYMQQALVQARKAAGHDEVPIGVIIEFDLQASGQIPDFQV